MEAADALLVRDRILRAERNFAKMYTCSMEAPVDKQLGKNTESLALKGRKR